LIKFQNVAKTYPNGVQALKNVNLEIKDGEFVAIIGLSGAGKSTLLRLINKMIDSTEGQIIIDDTEVSSLTGKKLRLVRRNIGMIFQSFNLVKRTSVYNNVLAGRVAYHSTFKTIFGLFPKEDKLIALEAIETLGILDKAFIRADQLSGGQQQRVALARALAQKPKIILADEPVASLDPITTIYVMNDFKRINSDFGITVVANMHHVDLALKYATRIIGIKAGEIVYDGPSHEITDDLLVHIYGRSLKSDEVLGDIDENI
jgi:phosphonate transport system ATP-binding protein